MTQPCAKDPSQPCPCQSGHSYRDCCQPLHQGTPATNPQALMRSRYTAYVLGLNDYLLATWDVDTRPTDLDADTETDWKRLQILGSGQTGDAGWVEFRATWVDNGQWQCLAERSRFHQRQGRWYYTDGEPRIERLQPGRNDSCPCGSGRKFKKCCGG